MACAIRPTRAAITYAAPLVEKSRWRITNEIHKAATLEIELARREVLRNLKEIKEYVGTCWHNAHIAKEYSKEDAEDAFSRINIVIERQAAK